MDSLDQPRTDIDGVATRLTLLVSSKALQHELWPADTVDLRHYFSVPGMTSALAHLVPGAPRPLVTQDIAAHGHLLPQ